MRRYDPDRPRWRQGLLNWAWLLWPTCTNRSPRGTRCRQLLGHARWDLGGREHRGYGGETW